MNRSRRGFLRDMLLAAAFAAGGLTIWWRSRLPALADETATLAALVDTLIPADETPGALELGIAGKVLVAFKADANLARLARAGLQWFDRTAELPFAQLPQPARDAIVDRAAAASRGSVERDFFDQLRHLTLGFYLAHPQSLRGLADAGPPLPVGYPDQAQPPRRG